MADASRPDPSDSPLPLARALSPAERERVVEQLSEAFANDVVGMDEFERRVARAYAAASVAELRALTEDLAPGAPGNLMPAVHEEPVRRIGGVFTNIERSGPQVLPARLEIRAVLANIELNLTRARLTAPVTVIDVRCVLGNVELRLPAGVVVDNEGGGFLGSFECYDSLGKGEPGAPIVRIVGRATLGAVFVAVAHGE